MYRSKFTPEPVLKKIGSVYIETEAIDFIKVIFILVIIEAIITKISFRLYEPFFLPNGLGLKAETFSTGRLIVGISRNKRLISRSIS